VAHGLAADQVADFFRQVVGMVAGALQRLGHEKDVDAVAAGHASHLFQAADDDEVAEPVDFRVGAQDGDSTVQIALGEGMVSVGQHALQRRGYHRTSQGERGGSVRRETRVIGQNISHYRILEELGRGRMGVCISLKMSAWQALLDEFAESQPLIRLPGGPLGKSKPC